MHHKANASIQSATKRTTQALNASSHVRTSDESRYAVFRWCTTKAPAGPPARLMQGWAALAALLLQIVAAHRSSLPDASAQAALNGLVTEALQTMSHQEGKSDR